MSNWQLTAKSALCLALTIALVQPAFTSNAALASDNSGATAIFAAPPAPTYYAPANGATGLTQSVQLKFNNSAGATRYNVQVARDAGFTNIVSHVNVPHSPVYFTAPDPGATYYWRVNAANLDGASKWGAVWNFTTGVATPILLTPLNGAHSVPLTVDLRFSNVAGATRYNVQVSTNAAFSAIIFKTNVPHSPVHFTAPAPGIYYWRAQAVVGTVASKYSASWSFSNLAADEPSLSAPVMLTPLNHAVNQPTSVELRFKPVAGALRYNVQVASDASFANILHRMNVPGSPVRLYGTPGEHCYWRVQSVGATEVSHFSQGWDFTMITTEAASFDALSAMDATETIPTAYALHDNYPNPFNPSTTITVDLPESGTIRLAVYDLLGQEIMTLASGNVEAGRHTYSFDASGLSSGMYLYRIESAAFTQTKRMVLLK